MNAACVPRNAALAKPFEGLPRRLAMLAIDATPNGTFDKTNLSNITAKRTRTAKEVEPLWPENRLQLGGVPMVGKVLLHGFASGPFQNRLPGGGPF